LDGLQLDGAKPEQAQDYRRDLCALHWLPSCLRVVHTSADKHDGHVAVLWVGPTMLSDLAFAAGVDGAVLHNAHQIGNPWVPGGDAEVFRRLAASRHRREPGLSEELGGVRDEITRVGMGRFPAAFKPASNRASGIWASAAGTVGDCPCLADRMIVVLPSRPWRRISWTNEPTCASTKCSAPASTGSGVMLATSKIVFTSRY
jgi:hypothetical protein